MINGLKTAGIDSVGGGVPVPPLLDTGVLVVDADNVGKVLTALKVK